MSVLGLFKGAAAAKRRTVYEQYAQITVTIPANQPANSVLQANITLDPLEGARASVTVPKGETWILSDLYIRSSSDVPVETKLIFVKNDRENVLDTQPLSVYVVTNPSRPLITPITLEEGDKLTIRAINLVAGPATAQTVTAFIKLQRLVS